VANLPPVLLIPVENCHRVIDTVENLPPVSTTLAKLGQNLPPVSLIPVANLPPVLLIPVVHLDLRLSPRIFEKIQNDYNGILWGWGETDS
jgi:hypothetical protein